MAHAHRRMVCTGATATAALAASYRRLNSLLCTGAAQRGPAGSACTGTIARPCPPDHPDPVSALRDPAVQPGRGARADSQSSAHP